MRERSDHAGNRSATAVWSVLTLLAGLLIMTGCGVEDPASPGSSDSSSSPWIGDAPQGDMSLGRGAPPWAGIPVQTTTLIYHDVGGQLASGRYTVDIPPEALPWNVFYTMEYRTTGIVRVGLGPHGAQFNEPVTVSIDLNGTSARPTDDITLYWFDESKGVWVDVGGDWDPSTMTLTAKLDHFSEYQPGRAGW